MWHDALTTSRRGFTLIEVIIVIAIISIVSSTILVSLASGRASRETERWGHTFAASVRQAQSYALTGRVANLTEENCYFAIRVTDVSTYSVVNYYRAGGNCDNVQVLETNTLTNGVQFTGVASYPKVYAFQLPRAAVYTGTSGALAPLGSTDIIGFTKAGTTRSVCLYPSGRVEEIGAGAVCP